MNDLETVLLPSLRSLPEDAVAEMTADGHAFASPEWYALLENLDLSAVVQAETRLSFAVTMRRGVPVAVVPLLSVQGPHAYFLYSLRRYYFEYWLDEAVRLHPERREHYARLMTGVNAFRRALEWTGAPLDRCLLVGSPLSFRCLPAVAPDAPRRRVFAQLLKDLQRIARRSRLPLAFLGVVGGERGDPWCDALQNAGCQKSFLFYDNLLELEGFETFDEYLHSFRRTTRRAFERDLKRTAAAGVDLRIVESFGGRAERFAELYGATYARYGASYFRHDAEFWRTLERTLGSKTEAVIATHGEELLGFSVLVESARRGEMFAYRIGRRADAAWEDVPYYFCLSFYAPIRRALELGYRKLWLGPASYEAKRVRGAVQVPLFNYYWFPRRWDRAALGRYLQLFGEITKQQLDQSFEAVHAVGQAARDERFGRNEIKNFPSSN